MSRQNSSLFDLLLKLPWQVSAVLGLIVFVGLRWGAPAWGAAHDKNLQPFAEAISGLAPLALTTFALVAMGSFYFSKKRRDLVDQQTSLETLQATSWKDFEFLVAEAYRRQGYQVDYSLGRGTDGGVDLVLKRNGLISLVQCKQWKVLSVGAPVIREMFGLLVAENADETIIVTSGKFTQQAQHFAQGKPIKLVDGPQLLALVQAVQTRPKDSLPEAKLDSVPTPVSNPDPACPSCGKTMILRTARRGSNIGNQFWGCSAYPACKGTRQSEYP